VSVLEIGPGSHGKRIVKGFGGGRPVAIPEEGTKTGGLGGLLRRLPRGPIRGSGEKGVPDTTIPWTVPGSTLMKLPGGIGPPKEGGPKYW